MMRYFSLQLVLLLVLTAHVAYSQNPTSGDDYSQRGIARFEKNDLEGAIADFSKAIELNSQNLGFCYYFRGIAQYRLGRIDDALTDLNKAISLKQHPRFYDNRGNLLAHKGNFDGALDDLNRAIEMEPKYAKAYGDRAIVHLMRGESVAAEADFNKCFQLDKTLEPQFKEAATRIKQRAILRSEHKPPNDLEVVKFSWKEVPSQMLVGSSPTIAVPTTGVSASGTRILADPTAKGDPGPPPVRDAPTFPSMREPTTVVKGVDYKFNLVIRNTGAKTIVLVQWAYFFNAKDAQNSVAYLVTSKTNLSPGKEKTLSDQGPAGAILGHGKPPTAYNRDQFEERVVILRLEYTDGSSWQSSGHASGAK